MYNNIGKRDILIFPKFDNMKIIEKIRNKYDRLWNLVAPHISLAFPFNDKISNEDLISKLSALLKKHSHFEVTFKGISLSDDNYILLNCVKGNYEILKLFFIFGFLFFYFKERKVLHKVNASQFDASAGIAV